MEEVSRALTYVWRMRVRKVRGVVTRNVGVILAQVGADELAVNSLEIVVGLAICGGDGQIKVSGVHTQWPQSSPYDSVPPQKRIGNQHSRRLCAILAHDLDPANVLPSCSIVDDVRTIKTLRRVQRGGRVLLIRRDNQPMVFPVVQVLGAVASNTQMPDAAIGLGLFLILAVPVKGAVDVDDRTTMCLDAVSVGVQPNVAGLD